MVLISTYNYIWSTHMKSCGHQAPISPSFVINNNVKLHFLMIRILHVITKFQFMLLWIFIFIVQCNNSWNFYIIVLELVIFQDVNGVQESKFSRSMSFAMIHKSGEALKEDSGNPLIFVNIVMLCYHRNGAASGRRR
jgi:hypothetical protein